MEISTCAVKSLGVLVSVNGGVSHCGDRVRISGGGVVQGMFSTLLRGVATGRVSVSESSTSPSWLSPRIESCKGTVDIGGPMGIQSVVNTS